MPGQLLPDTRCPECGREVLAVFRKWRADACEMEFLHADSWLGRGLRRTERAESCVALVPGGVAARWNWANEPHWLAPESKPDTEGGAVKKIARRKMAAAVGGRPARQAQAEVPDQAAVAARVSGLHGRIAADVEAKLGPAFLRCESCGTERDISAGEYGGYLASGWPRCCGNTMSLEHRR